jgi:hypothetical protein
VLLLALALAWTTVWQEGPAGTGRGHTTLRAEKQDGDVVFVIANSGHSHEVSRSTAPHGGSSDRFLATTGVFRDSLDSGPDLVYYRID